LFSLTDWRTEYVQSLERLINDEAAREFLEPVMTAVRSAESGESVGEQETACRVSLRTGRFMRRHRAI
jgi:hypothetical protein